MSGTDHDYLGIYLNDHLTGAVGGTELAKRIAKAHRERPAGARLRELADEIAADRASLTDIMAALEIPVRHYRIGLAWVGEKVGRAKLNGRLLARSPLSDVIEFELMRLGVEGKAAAWRSLRGIAQHDTRLDEAELDRLIARAHAQIDVLEDLRVQAAKDTFAPR